MTDTQFLSMLHGITYRYGTDRNVLKSIKVGVYRNLNNGLVSIKALEGEHKGKVIAHAEGVLLRDCSFKVGEKGRQRVLKEKRKNVHAYVEGYVDSIREEQRYRKFLGTKANYNPYHMDSFYIEEKQGLRKKLKGAKYCAVYKSGLVWVEKPEYKDSFLHSKIKGLPPQIDVAGLLKLK
jgi:hypothetical protein